MDRTTASLTPISIDELSQNLRSELDCEASEVACFEAADLHEDAAPNAGYHVVWCEATGRGGAVYVGSGSSGVTGWTDADDAADVLRRFLDDDLIN